MGFIALRQRLQENFKKRTAVRLSVKLWNLNLKRLADLLALLEFDLRL